MSVAERIVRYVERRFTEAERTRARLELLSCSDRQLADRGLSRELLEAGNDAWPWRAPDAAAPPRASAPDRAHARPIVPPAGLRGSAVHVATEAAYRLAA